MWTRCFLLLAAAMVLVEARPASAARTVYVLQAFDTEDAVLAKHAAADAGNMARLFRQNIPRQALKYETLQPAQMTPDGIRTAIHNVPADADDAIVFLYCGHGAYEASQGEHVFVLRNNTQRVARTAVLESLQQKNVGLVVLLSNACFDYLQPPKPVFAAPAERDNVALSPLFATLFFERNGVVDVTACARDEKAYSHLIPVHGTFFFSAFGDACFRLKNSSTVDWNTVVDDVSERVKSAFTAEVKKAQYIQTSDGDQLRQKTQTVTTNRLDVRRVESLYSGPPPSDVARVKSVRLGVTVASHGGVGVKIEAVDAGGPATGCLDSNGKSWRLTAGDFISEINGSPVGEIADFIRLVRGSPSNMSFVVLGADDNRRYAFSTTLNNLDGTAVGGNPGGGNNQTRFGAYVRDGNGRVEVTGTVPDSPATRCRNGDGNNWRLDPGDVITHVNGRRVQTEGEFRQSISESPRVIRLRVIGGADGAVYEFTATLNY